MSELWFLLVLAIAVTAVVMLAIAFHDMHEAIKWHYGLDERMTNLSTIVQRSIASLKTPPTSGETINDENAYGGAVTSADYWSSQEKDTDTTDDYVMCADRDCQGFGLSHNGDHQPLKKVIIDG